MSTSTPSYIADRLQAAGWRRVGDNNWQRPGAHPDLHSWPVADLIQRTDEPHHPAAAEAAPRPRRPGFQMRGSNRRARVATAASRAARPVGQPRKVELIRSVVAMHDEQKLTFRDIAAVIGGKPSRAFYLYRQAGKCGQVAHL